jgi:hypothetical protein
MCVPSSRGGRRPARPPPQSRDRADDDHDGPAQRASGVDILSEADELDVKPVQFIQYFKVVLDRASYPVAGSDQNHIEVVTASVSHHLIESGAACLHAAEPVRIFVEDLVATLFSHLPQVEKLGLGVLIHGRDPHIENSAFHLRRPFGLGACLAMYDSMNFNSSSVMFWPRTAVAALKALCNSTGTFKFIRFTCCPATVTIDLTSSLQR